MTRLLALALAVAATVLVVGSPSSPLEPGGRTEVVVLLDAPPLARAPGTDGRIASEQRAFRRELAVDVPGARIGWRYRLVANGYSLSLPSSDLDLLRALPGVRDVLPGRGRLPPGGARLRRPLAALSPLQSGPRAQHRDPSLRDLSATPGKTDWWGRCLEHGSARLWRRGPVARGSLVRGTARRAARDEIGRASCRERVFRVV